MFGALWNRPRSVGALNRLPTTVYDPTFQKSRPSSGLFDTVDVNQFNHTVWNSPELLTG